MLKGWVISARCEARLGCGKLPPMKILVVDIGTGTQDIFLYNSRLDMENNFKLVVPSPTMIVRQNIQRATERQKSILLTGVTMGGGPSTWAVEHHLRLGLSVYATSDAARTFNDDLNAVAAMGIVVVSEDEAVALPEDVLRLSLKDFDFSSIQRALQAFGVSLDDLNAVGVGVFDHGNAPAGVSDRQFRFDYLDERIRKLNKLSAFAYRADDIPLSMTRMQCVAESARNFDCPFVVMDTAPAAVLGATLDPVVANMNPVMIANIGNFHTLAFRLGSGKIEGLFEHHTGFLSRSKLERLLHALAEGSIRREDVFNDQGHGALMYDVSSIELGEREFDVVITGPRRSLFARVEGENPESSLRAYYPAPFGDMMITGCFGILSAMADVVPELAEPIRASLRSGSKVGTAPWEVE
jgi:uncharacterized protein (DUF1786 family)